MVKTYHAYIMASRRNGTLYAGVTSNLAGRVWQHKNGVFKGFTKKYGVELLVWFEAFENVLVAIQREKNIKKWPRKWKLNLIEAANPEWRDLYHHLWPEVDLAAFEEKLRDAAQTPGRSG